MNDENLFVSPPILLRNPRVVGTFLVICKTSPPRPAFPTSPPPPTHGKAHGLSLPLSSLAHTAAVPDVRPHPLVARPGHALRVAHRSRGAGLRAVDLPGGGCVCA